MFSMSSFETRVAARDAGLPDVLDAYAATASAMHVVAGDHEELGGQPDNSGLTTRIVF